MYEDFPNLPKPRCNNSFSPEQKQKITKKKGKTRNRNTQAKTETHIPEQKHATRKRSTNPDTAKHFHTQNTRKNKSKMETQQRKQNQRYKTETTTRKRHVTKNRLPFIISWYKTNGRIMPSVELSIKIVPSLPRISFLLPLPRVISRQLQEKQAFCFPELAQGGGEELCLALIPVKFTTRITL